MSVRVSDEPDWNDLLPSRLVAAINAFGEECALDALSNGSLTDRTDPAKARDLLARAIVAELWAAERRGMRG